MISESVEIVLIICLFLFLLVRSYLVIKKDQVLIASGKDPKSIMMNDSIIEIIVNKLFSGSFSMLVMFGITYCAVILLCTYLAAKGKIPINEYLILVAGMSGTFTMLWKDYLSKIAPENKQPTNGGNGNGHKETNDTSSILVNGITGSSGVSESK